MPIRMVKVQNSENTRKNVEKQELSYIAGGNTKLHHHFGRQFGGFLQN